ncbi:MAG TPA: hypothetical protein DCM05_02525 [Elusimicrobia bacterium]|nr:hypothetical protein [Elusimicrobiota bacterium]
MARLSSVLLFASLLAVQAHAGVFPEDPFTDKATGTTGAAFLKLPAGGRIPSLGGASAAAVDNSEAMFWNPAGLSRLEAAGRPDAAMGYSNLLETMYSGALAYAHPLPEQKGVLGASFVYFSQSAIQGYSTVGDPTSEFAPNDLALAFGYARQLKRVRLGSSLKYIRSEIDDASGSTFALDFGLQVERITDLGESPLDLGLAILNFGPPIKVGSMSDPLPFKAAVGALWHISPRFNGLLDANLPVDSDPYFCLGAEYNQPFGEGFGASVRGGYNMRYARDLEGFSGASAGLGVDLRRVRLDYAWVPFGDLGTTHRIAIGARF